MIKLIIWSFLSGLVSGVLTAYYRSEELAWMR